MLNFRLFYVEPQIQRFYDALKGGYHGPLEELVKGAKYHEIFNPLDTELMQRTDEGRLDYWRSTSLGLAACHPIIGDQAKRIVYETMPKEHWYDEYMDLFTMTKKCDYKEEFVDCWRVNRSGKVAM